MSLFTVLASSKVAASVLAAGTLAVGGTGVAAVSGALPAEAQQTAHELFGAPAPELAADAAAKGQAIAEAATGAAADADASAEADAAADATVSEDSVAAQASGSAAANTAVDAAGAAAFGLCTAFTNGGLNANSEAFSSLVIAADGEATLKATAPMLLPRPAPPPKQALTPPVPPPSRLSVPRFPQFPPFRPFRMLTASPPFLLSRPFLPFPPKPATSWKPPRFPSANHG
ncbi:hypothetical protein [Arthrobacter nitrophenolicus]|uniref:Protein tyrosine phosphatase, receptor type, F-like protein n=1 Tax=Arthrobacter nitrophenolicus TaxID=683150 RepID=L8TML0_9MICC|nr:protein tyrosine phosphatase, receptor type, F-like protein [Arthrobacter nitrophenolicus]